LAKKKGKYFIDKTNLFISSAKTLMNYRVSKKDFTRDRKLTFEGLVLCMLKLLRQNLQIELNAYFSAVRTAISNTVVSFTSSAFVQSRKKLKPDLFYDLNTMISNEFYLDNDERVKLFKGHRLLSIDGSTIQLPINEDTIKEYGTFNNQKQTDNVVIGRVSIMYDLLNDMVLDGKLCHFSKGEVTLSRQHIKLAQENDIIIMDRAYPSFESIYEMQSRKIQFIYRCKVNFSNQVIKFYESDKTDEIVTIKPGQNRSFENLPYNKEEAIEVRMIKVVLPSGDIEVLMTSLINNDIYSMNEFSTLYNTRWGIETYYNRFKNIIGVEHFSGTSNQFIQQEFNCALYMSNMQSILTKDAQDEADEKYEGRKYEYKINASLSLNFIRNKLIELFTENKNSDQILEDLKELFVKNVIPIRPNRKFERKPDKYRQRTKPKQFHNRRTIL
jgi:hypothetical protein